MNDELRVSLKNDTLQDVDGARSHLNYAVNDF